MSKISIVVPCYFEQEVLPQTLEALSNLKIAPHEKELIFVDDGSGDATFAMLKLFARANPDTKIISFSRNFGHQAAVTAGMRASTGDAVVVIDADLQDPPEVIPELIKKWEEGAQIVYGKRLKRHGESVLKKISAWGYYRLLSLLGAADIPKDTGDFRLIDRQVCDVLNDMGEHNRYLRGMSAWAGFKSEPVEYVRAARAAGKTKYSLKKMLRLAGDGITSFSDRPLKISLVVGMIGMFLSIVYFLLSVIFKIVGHWQSMHILFALAFILISLLFLVLGVMGVYIGRIYDEAKDRPDYIIRKKINLS